MVLKILKLIFMNKIIAILTIYFTFINVALSTPKIDAKTAILMDYNSSEILYELEPDQEIYPA